MKGVAAVIRENIEAFAVAIAMALVIRHFCLEAFRIPTGSMMPTLYGNHLGPEGEERHGDRILVDKLGYLLREPRRFEVAVFQYPLNRNRNFIKRIAGLGGDWIRLIDGDIWVSRDEGGSWSIARKPAGARNQLLIDYYPEPQDREAAYLRGGNWKVGFGWDIDESERRFSVDASGESEMLFRHDVRPYPDIDNDDTLRVHKPFVGDVRVSFELDVERRGQLEVRIVEHGVRHELVLGATASYVRAGGPGSVRREIDVRLESGSDYDVSFANVDDTLFVVIDGDETEIEFENTIGTPPELSNQFGTSDIGFLHSISIVATDVKATITDIDIDRDVYYCERGDRSTYHGTITWKVPDGHFFMMGDNNKGSQDSRLWNVAQAQLKDGTVIEFDPGARDGVNNPLPARPSRGSLVVVEEDIGGLRREFDAADIKEWSSGLERPFVPADHLIGRALSVFWPIYVPRLYSGPSRIKLIR